jgi:MFS family permease
MIYRALTGLGVGGVFGLAVALVADALPDTARPRALGMLQALSAVGNVTAGLCAMALSGVDPLVSWKYCSGSGRCRPSCASSSCCG